MSGQKWQKREIKPITGDFTGNISAYTYEGFLQEEPFKDSRVVRPSEDDDYAIMTDSVSKDPQKLKERTKIAAGLFDVSVPAEEGFKVAYVRRNRDAKVAHGKTDPGMDRGHSSIARGKAVVFAGELLFGGDPTVTLVKDYDKFKAGELVYWTNKSGHYAVGRGQGAWNSQQLIQHIAEQTRFLVAEDGTPLLPMDKFRPHDPNSD